VAINNIDKLDLEKFKKLGVSNLLDLALILPKSYENSFLSQTPNLGAKNTLHVKVLRAIQNPKAFHLRFFVYGWEEEISGVVFQAKNYHRKMFQIGKDLYVNGKLEWQNGKMSIIQPTILNEINRLVPKYKTSLQNRSVLSLMEKYLHVPSLINEGLQENEAKLLYSLHKPSLQEVLKLERGWSKEILDAVKFVEIFNYLKKLQKKKIFFDSKKPLLGDEKSFVSSLPFELTDDQKKAIADIKKDFSSQKATKRIVMGDVGSGKTLVILASVMMCYPNKSTIMAPTTILANQIFKEAKKFLASFVKITLVTNTSSKKEDLEEFDFIVGTHALLYRDLPEFDLVMIDEQHRFGVKQRELIHQLSVKAKKHPHFLQFSATPIPRTMSMIQSELVDFSFIKQTPFKKDIDTNIIHKNDFKKLVEHIKQEIQNQRQVLVVYPLVEESETIEYQSIDEGRGYWEKNFSNVYVTHGGDKEKQSVLEEFRDKGDILISTTVVEVGISLPKLSTIVIVAAERLGLATLHQLRGRVSRNGLKGYCFLYTNLEKSKRLEDFCTCKDGFEIAELDLKYRKGGDVFGGQRQSGEKFEFYDLEEEILRKAQQRLGA
jgi:ATP-dependent DNA helicase RecG